MRGEHLSLFDNIKVKLGSAVGLPTHKKKRQSEKERERSQGRAVMLEEVDSVAVPWMEKKKVIFYCFTAVTF